MKIPRKSISPETLSRNSSKHKFHSKFINFYLLLSNLLNCYRYFANRDSRPQSRFTRTGSKEAWKLRDETRNHRFRIATAGVNRPSSHKCLRFLVVRVSTESTSGRRGSSQLTHRPADVTTLPRRSRIHPLSQPSKATLVFRDSNSRRC